MNKHFKNYLNSFKFDSFYWKTFLYDFSFFAVLLLFFYLTNAILQSKLSKIMGGKTTEQLQQSLLNSPEATLPIMQQLLGYLVVTIVILLIFCVSAFLVYALIRAKIWNTLQHKSFTKKKYWKWNVLNLALVIPSLIYLLFYLFVKTVFSGVLDFLLKINSDFYFQHPYLMESISLSLNGIATFILLLLWIVIVFLTYYSFTQKYKVWESIGESFHLLKKHWSRLWKLLLLTTLTALLLTLVLWPIKSLLANQTFVLTLLNLITSVLYLAWFRIYLVKTIA
jgi:hypothetical protein